MITITLAAIEHTSGPKWEAAVKANGGENADFDRPFAVSSLLDACGLSDTLWRLQSMPEYDYLWRKFAWWCAIQSPFSRSDERISACLDAVDMHSAGLITDKELIAARVGALAALAALEAEKPLHWREISDAALAAVAAAYPSAADAAREAASTASRAVADAIDAAAGVEPRDSASWDLPRSYDIGVNFAQAQKLREILDAGGWVD